MKTAEELIQAIRVNAPNLYHIAETGNINGSLKNDLEKIITDLLVKVSEQEKEIERLRDALEKIDGYAKNVRPLKVIHDIITEAIL